ncbi:hypothetical protein JCM12141A_19480 [Mycolicibacterium hodleri]
MRGPQVAEPSAGADAVGEVAAPVGVRDGTSAAAAAAVVVEEEERSAVGRWVGWRRLAAAAVPAGAGNWGRAG